MPIEHESSPITTRPGLPPLNIIIKFEMCFSNFLKTYKTSYHVQIFAIRPHF